MQQLSILFRLLRPASAPAHMRSQIAADSPLGPPLRVRCKTLQNGLRTRLDVAAELTMEYGVHEEPGFVNRE